MVREDARWFKSSYSGGSGTECVEVANLGTSVDVRDSKRPLGPGLSLHHSTWAGFMAFLQRPDNHG
ncbi:DUF397 domain-containing protein [Streptomyces sp. NPDC057429]|uniref:DUF397 domain-containing protein n=1 Tax=Streptomyces sp. NPDC057429 TaxID=3346130 RepID=UPI00367FDB03